MQALKAVARPFRSYPGRLVFWGLGALVLRVAYAYSFPIFLTNDSWDYLRAAYDLYHRFDFLSGGLRDVRLPGYPVFLALTYPITGLQSDRIVWLQIGLGLLAVGLGLAIGQLLASRLAAEVLVIFLGLNPVYVFIEHTLMTETLFLVSLLAVVALTIACLRGPLTLSRAALLGFLMAASVLIRVNVLPFYLILVAGIGLFRLAIDAQDTSIIGGVKALSTRIIILGCVAMLTALPWLIRNYREYGSVSLVNFGNRNMLVFMAMHYPLDYALPTTSQVNQELGGTVVGWEWLWKVQQRFGTQAGEKVAATMLAEQVTAHPRAYVAAVLGGLLGIGGMHGEDVKNERTAVLGWFRDDVGDVEALNQQYVAWQSAEPSADSRYAAIASDYQVYLPLIAGKPDLNFRYVAVGGDSWFNRMLRQGALFYLQVVRPLLYVLALAWWVIFMVRGMISRDFQRLFELRIAAIILFGAAYIGSAVVHAVTMLDGDRFALPYDWILVLLLILIYETWPLGRAKPPLAPDRASGV